MSRGHTGYDDVMELPLPLFLHMPRFFDPAGLFTLLKLFKMSSEDGEVKGKSEGKQMIPDLGTQKGIEEYKRIASELHRAQKRAGKIR